MAGQRLQRLAVHLCVVQAVEQMQTPGPEVQLYGLKPGSDLSFNMRRLEIKCRANAAVTEEVGKFERGVARANVH